MTFMSVNCKMKRRGRGFSYLFLILQAAVPQPALCDDILTKARTANENLYSSLQSFVCHERIERYRGPLNAETGRALDTVTANLSFENGVEHYSDVRQNTRPRDGISNLAGAWSEGEFGTLLLQTETLLKTQPVSFQALATLGDVATAIYRFDVAEEISPWDLDVGGRHYRLPFRTDVWISTETGEIVKIARTSLGIAAETRISALEWKVTLEPVELNGKRWLLPKTGEYAVLYDQSNRREWNLMNFSDYRRYGSEVALRFDAQ
jgi:hypothetical protein